MECVDTNETGRLTSAPFELEVRTATRVWCIFIAQSVIEQFQGPPKAKRNLTHLFQWKVLVSSQFNTLDRNNLYPRCVNRSHCWLLLKCEVTVTVAYWLFPVQTINRNQTRHFGSVRTCKIRDTVGGHADLCWVRFVTASSKVPICKSKHCSLAYYCFSTFSLLLYVLQAWMK